MGLVRVESMSESESTSMSRVSVVEHGRRKRETQTSTKIEDRRRDIVTGFAFTFAVAAVVESLAEVPP